MAYYPQFEQTVRAEASAAYIKADVAALVKKEKDNGITRRSDKLIDYTTFGQLSGMITSNWDLFEP